MFYSASQRDQCRRCIRQLTLPFDKIFCARCSFACRNHTVDDFASLEQFIAVFFVDLVGLVLLPSHAFGEQVTLDSPYSLNVIIDTLHALVTLEKLVCLVRVV